jgi:hypothetical protein
MSQASQTLWFNAVPFLAIASRGGRFPKPPGAPACACRKFALSVCPGAASPFLNVARAREYQIAAL